MNDNELYEEELTVGSPHVPDIKKLATLKGLSVEDWKCKYPGDYTLVKKTQVARDPESAAALEKSGLKISERNIVLSGNIEADGSMMVRVSKDYIDTIDKHTHYRVFIHPLDVVDTPRGPAPIYEEYTDEYGNKGERMVNYDERQAWLAANSVRNK